MKVRKLDRKAFLNIKQEQLLSILHKGEKNAKTSSELSRELGIPQERWNRTVRVLAKELLLERKIPVCSSVNGFFIGNVKEMRKFAASLKSQIITMERDISALDSIVRKKLKKK